MLPFQFKTQILFQKSIFRVKPKWEQPHPNKCRVSAMYLSTATWSCWQCLTGPRQKTLGYNHSRQFLIEVKPLYVRPSSFIGIISYLPGLGPSRRLNLRCSRLIHVLLLSQSSSCQAQPGACSDQSPQFFFPSALPIYAFVDTGLSLFLRSAAFWTFSP